MGSAGLTRSTPGASISWDLPMKPRLSQRLQFSLVYLLVGAIVLSLLQSWLLAQPTVELTMSDFQIGRASCRERVYVLV